MGSNFRQASAGESLTPAGTEAFALDANQFIELDTLKASQMVEVTHDVSGPFAPPLAGLPVGGTVVVTLNAPITLFLAPNGYSASGGTPRHRGSRVASWSVVLVNGGAHGVADWSAYGGDNPEVAVGVGAETRFTVRTRNGSTWRIDVAAAPAAGSGGGQTSYLFGQRFGSTAGMQLLLDRFD